MRMRSTVTETLDKFKIYGEKTIEFSFNFDNLVLVKLGNKIIKILNFRYQLTIFLNIKKI